MKRGPRWCIALLLCGAILGPMRPALASPSARAPRQARADSLCRVAERHLASTSIDDRRRALRDLDEAVVLAPDDPAIRLTLGKACLAAGFTTRARDCYERAARLAPESAAARFGLGVCWKRDWLDYLEDSSWTEAVGNLKEAVRLDSSLAEAWLTLAPLLYEGDDRRGALDAARRAYRADPERAEAEVALAYLEYRAGDVERAESLFEHGIPGLPAALSSRFIDLEPLLTPEDFEIFSDLAPAEQREFERRFWSEADPDPTTPENEARLEYWARVAHAALVYLEPPEPRWDARADLYVRYGTPSHTYYDPAGFATDAVMGTGLVVGVQPRYSKSRAVGVPMWFPYHSQVMVYPELGMRVQLNDIALSQRYELPRSLRMSSDPRPDQRALARNDLLATSGGRAMFPVLPPGVAPLRMEGCIARFEGERQIKLLAQIEAPGTPEDSVWAQCVVMDANERPVARTGHALAPSACDPTELRTGDFSFELPPGVYRLAFSVRDTHGRRGVTRVVQRVESAPAGLAMSDVVVTCGAPDVNRGVPEVRLGPNLKARVAGDEPLRAYFEIYRMRPGADGVAHFEYEYSVEPESEAARPWYQRLLPAAASPYAVKSEESNVGPLRRQFISVPVQSLQPGHYRLVVKVRDLATGAVVTASTRFERVGGSSTGI